MMKVRYNRIVCNKAQCTKCMDIIESVHRHDFVTCKCGALSVDGGKSYLKRCGDIYNYKELSEQVKDLRIVEPKWEDFYRQNYPDDIIEE